MREIEFNKLLENHFKKMADSEKIRNKKSKMIHEFWNNGIVEYWGSHPSARRCNARLPQAAKDAIANGDLVILGGCPPYRGETRRRLVKINGRYYARMLEE